MTTLANVPDAREAAHYSAAGPEPNILFQNEQIKVIAAGLQVVVRRSGFHLSRPPREV